MISLPGQRRHRGEDLPTNHILSDGTSVRGAGPALGLEIRGEGGQMARLGCDEGGQSATGNPPSAAIRCCPIGPDPIILGVGRTPGPIRGGRGETEEVQMTRASQLSLAVLLIFAAFLGCSYKHLYGETMQGVDLKSRHRVYVVHQPKDKQQINSMIANRLQRAGFPAKPASPATRECRRCPGCSSRSGAPVSCSAA